MLYRRFGRTGLQMPVYSCGGMRYQYKWQDLPLQDIPADNQRNLEATIERSLQLGINHIETARGYGSSEMQLGQILPKFPRQQLIVQTKVGPKPTAQAFQETFAKSLAYLRLDYVDLLAIHGINTPEDLELSKHCLEVAQMLQQQGKVRSIGFSTHGPTEVIVQAIQTNQFDYVNLHWYYINQVNWPAIAAAQELDLGVFIISPSDKGGMLYKPPQKLVELCAPLSPMVFNDLFCLSHPQVHTLSLGAARPSDFDEHLLALNYLDQADQILPEIIERLENAAIARLGEDWYKTWRVGLPRYQDTPENINIPTILWLYNLAVAYDMYEFAKARYSLLTNGGNWFPGNNAAPAQTVDLSSCLARSPHRDRIPQILVEAHELLGGEQVKRLSQS